MISELEVFKDITSFRKPKRAFRVYTLGFWEQTVEKWHNENGISIDEDLYAYFGFDADPAKMMVPGRTGAASIPFTPMFDIEVLNENDTIIIKRDTDGIVHVVDKKTAGRRFYSFPVSTKEDWLKIKDRLDSKSHDFGKDYETESKKRIYNDTVNMLFFCGPFAFHRNLMGYENLSYAYYDMPEVIEDMSAKWLEFYRGISKKMLDDMRIDFVIFHEDMGYKTGPLIGPDHFKRFLSPYYDEMIRFFKNEGIDTIAVDTDGNVDILLPLFHELGVNMMTPFEQAAGNDIFAVRDKYPELIMWGGIDKRVLNKGKEEIKKEVYSKVPVMWEKGGYFPSLDHSTQPCPMENFIYMIKLLDEICG